MKKSKIWAISNLIMTILIVVLFIFACTYEVNAFEAHVKKLQEQGEQFAGLGALGLVIIIVLVGIIYAVALVFLAISSIGLFKTDKIGFLIVGAIGKIIVVGGMFLMGAGSVSEFARMLYGILSIAYLGGAVLDFVFSKKLKE